MHYLFGLRGDFLDQQRLINRISSIAYSYPFFKDKEGKELLGHNPVLGRVEPIQLYSYVFPKEYQDHILNGLGGTKENMGRWYQGGTFKQKMMWGALRSALHCEKIPETTDPKKNINMFLPLHELRNLSIMPIGIKKDIELWEDKTSELDGKPIVTYHEAL